MTLFSKIEWLMRYGVYREMMTEDDIPVVRNNIWQFLDLVTDLDAVVTSDEKMPLDIYALLGEIADDSGKQFEFVYEYEIFMAQLMSYLMPRNSEVNQKFWQFHETSPQKSTDYFYKLSKNSTYIRMDRVSRNVVWQTPTDYGMLDMTINLSKPEKDPKEIEMQKHAKPSLYPKCLLCAENAGFSGGVNHPPRQNHRLVRLDFNGENWYLQYSPYGYYNEHAIVLCQEHRPMKITHMTFERLAMFVDLLPHYFIGSNADLPIVGGSILSHDHYQAGHYEMPMMRAESIFSFKLENGVQIEGLKWPLSVLKITGSDKTALLNVANTIFEGWLTYNNETLQILAHTDERHNTVTPIMTREADKYVLYLALRNNRTNDAYPEGIFHPHPEHHHIKKENIGLIEVMGLAVLPARLIDEIGAMSASILEEKGVNIAKLSKDVSLVKHLNWLSEISDRLSLALKNSKYEPKEAIETEIYACIGEKFSKVLEDAGVFKESYNEMEAFARALF